tara:strand:- start:108 stop:236 length:129 start_codon:yes stop_codon:yes gene_type:complete
MARQFSLRGSSELPHLALVTILLWGGISVLAVWGVANAYPTA